MNRNIAIVALLLVCMVFAGTSGVFAAGTKPTEPKYGQSYIQNNGAASYYIPFHGGSNISIDSSGWTCGVTVYTVNWNTVLYTKSFDDAAMGGTGKGFPGNDSHVWFVSAIDQMLSLMINMGGCKLDYTINMTNTTSQAPDLKPIYDLIEGLNQSINSINNTIQGLTVQTGFLKANITSILAEITVLKALVAADSINITALQAAIANLQGQLDDLKAEVSSINASVTNNINVTNNITQLADLTAINQSIADLTAALDDLNATVKKINIPPDMEGDVTKLKAENTKLKQDLADLQKKVGAINTTQQVINKTNYVNTTTTKKVSEGMGAGTMTGLAIGTIAAGAIIGGVAGAVAGRRKKGDEPPEIPQEPRAIPVARAKPRETPKPSPPEILAVSSSPEPTPENKDDIDDILGQLEAPKTDKDVDETPSDRLAKKVRIGELDYTESQIMSKLSSLPRGLPSEFFGVDPSELAAILMAQKYTRNDEGDLIFTYERKSYFGDPSKLGIYLQRARLPEKGKG